ncbi:hypothetical protein DES53_10297 [Roseimicrobium gellanilyticum]|uniref:Uncharacterized protein n=1 Tax=Roseimicrobium gellanilyticum TaxID=748857 RepID=A0A366HPW8_9BACT|nr:hypothetical protein [Roseimicrobium gellanilyticum]RBP45715.1 hypothetical protein DES53_10297 [Roseimicrobium gellanilyticum]
MKTRIAAAIFAVAALLTPACEQHSWKETSELFKEHGHGHAEGDHGKEHGDAHGSEKKADSHGAEAAHGEKKAAH